MQEVLPGGRRYSTSIRMSWSCFIEELNRDVFQESPFAVGGALQRKRTELCKRTEARTEKGGRAVRRFPDPAIYTERAL